MQTWQFETLVPLFLGDGPFPGVIDLFGTVGGLFEFRSALLASRGFASFSLPYFAFEDLPKTLEDVDFDYFLVSMYLILYNLYFDTKIDHIK